MKGQPFYPRTLSSPLQEIGKRNSYLMTCSRGWRNRRVPTASQAHTVDTTQAPFWYRISLKCFYKPDFLYKPNPALPKQQVYRERCQLERSNVTAIVFMSTIVVEKNRLGKQDQGVRYQRVLCSWHGFTRNECSARQLSLRTFVLKLYGR